MNRADYWRSAGHPPLQSIPLTSDYDSRKHVRQPIIEADYTSLELRVLAHHKPTEGEK